MPHATAHDEGLRNLIMSSYWAGYYAGVYDGKKAAGAPNEAVDGVNGRGRG
jgi:hypothetical protein